MPKIKLADMDLTSDETKVLYVVAFKSEWGTGFEYRYSQQEADEITHEELELPDHVPLYTFEVIMPFHEEAIPRINEQYEDHIRDHERALELAQQG